MMIVAGDYSLSMFEGTEQYSKPHRIIPHPLYNKTTNNADIMLIKVQDTTIDNIHIYLPFIFMFLITSLDTAVLGCLAK